VSQAADVDGAVLDLAKLTADAVRKQDMLAWQYNTVGVSDAITMGGDGRRDACCVFRFGSLTVIEACASPYKLASSSPIR
jgi:dihydroxyacid dehydratase/phosphogluconate dehydratase